MREYAKVGPKFWIGETGKQLRGNLEAQIVATYLMTSPHANMLGLYYLPMMFVAHETGLSLEGASKGLARAIEVGFCDYDEPSEVVWVREMAAYQIGDVLDPKDKRCKGVQNEYDALPENPFLATFFDRYAARFHMETGRGKALPASSPIEAPSEPHRSQEQEQETEQEQEKEPAAPTAPPAPRKRTRLPRDEILFDEFLMRCRSENVAVIPDDDPIFEYATTTGISVEMISICWQKFKSKHAGGEKRQKDWRATFRNAVRDNWYRLWYVDGQGNVALTTAGKLTEKAEA